MATETTTEKSRCCECDYVGTAWLSAPHPFVAGDVVIGCPKCHAVDSLRRCCDFDGCAAPVSSGTPLGDRYVFRCYKHNPHLTGELPATGGAA
jgi:hypothetical protein